MFRQMRSTTILPGLLVLSVSSTMLPHTATAVEILQMVFVERASSDAVTDTGSKGDSAGDILTFNNEIYDAANINKVGSNNGWCMRTMVGKAWECFWTLTLSDGQITVEGPFLDGKDSVLAITGGTGKYSGAKGEMGLHARNEKGTEYDFKYSIVK